MEHNQTSIIFNMGKASTRMYLLSRTRTPPIGGSTSVLSRKVHMYWSFTQWI